MAAFGLGTGAIGTTVAQEDGNGGGNEGANENDNGDSEHGEDGESSGVSVSIQLYTLRNLPDSTTDLIRRVGGVDNNGGPGYDAVEFAGLGESSQSEVMTALDETGVNTHSAHIGLGELEDNFEGTVETYTGLGVESFVVPYLDPSNIDTVEKVEELAQRMNDVAAQLEEEGVRLGFHNHDGEFQILEDDRTALEVFDETLDEGIIFEIDVGWVLTAGFDPVEVITKYSDRTELIHMKDMMDGEFTEIGEGGVNMSQVAEVARNEANVDYLIYEHDEPTDPASSVATGAGFLSFVDGKEGLECLEFSDIGGPEYSGNLGNGSDDGEEGDDNGDDGEGC